MLEYNQDRFYSPAIIIKRQPNKRRNGNNRNINPVRGNRGSNPAVRRNQGRQVVKPQLPTRLRRSSKDKQ